MWWKCHVHNMWWQVNITFYINVMYANLMEIEHDILYTWHLHIPFLLNDQLDYMYLYVQLYGYMHHILYTWHLHIPFLMNDQLNFINYIYMYVQLYGYMPNVWSMYTLERYASCMNNCIDIRPTARHSCGCVDIFIGKVVFICLRVSVNLVYKFQGKPGTTTVKHDFNPNGLKFHRGSPWVSILSWLNLKANKDYFSYEYVFTMVWTYD